MFTLGRLRLSEELEKVIYNKSEEKVNEKYRSLVERVKKNLILLHRFKHVTLVFLNKKVSVSKLRMNCEKFRKTCI